MDALDHPQEALSVDSADRLGIFVASFCAVQCALVPVLLAVLPAVSSALGDERLEWGLLLVAAVIVALTLRSSFPVHRSRSVVALLVGGVALLLVSRLLEEAGQPLVVFVGVSVAGGILLVAGHLRNLRLRHAVGATT